MNMSGAYQNPIYNQQMQQYGQQYAYNPYMNQPRIDNTQNYMQAPQQIQQQIPVQTFGINGKVVPAVENITANDVPMDGTGRAHNDKKQAVNACFQNVMAGAEMPLFV